MYSGSGCVILWEWSLYNGSGYVLLWEWSLCIVGVVVSTCGSGHCV